MFDLDIYENVDKDPVVEPSSKKQKMFETLELKPVHSSLDYTSLRAPPLVEYKSIENYCEIKVGKSLLPSLDKPLDLPSTSGVSNLQNISSPIVFKSPKVPSIKRTTPNDGPLPYYFFSVEELSLVKSLKHWPNTKVCPVGMVSFDCDSQQCYLNSVMEKGSWRLLLDTSLLKEIPKLQTLLQIYGVLEVNDQIPFIKVNFCRNLDFVHLPSFIESYQLIQKHVPVIVCTTEDKKDTHLDQSETGEAGCSQELNDTLDDYNFSLIM